jgi:hypothetical protein
MSAERAAMWRRWARSLPVLAALLFATGYAAAKPLDPAQAHSVGVALSGAWSLAPAASGERPDVPVLGKRNGGWVAGLGSHAVDRVATYRLPAPALGWLAGDAVAERHGTAGGTAYRGRAPPVGRAPTST